MCRLGGIGNWGRRNWGRGNWGRRPFSARIIRWAGLTNASVPNCSSVSHPHIDKNTSEEALRSEILADKTALEALLDYPVRGLSYPFGDYSNLLLKLMPGFGFVYGRAVSTTDSFGLPGNLRVWRGTSHHASAWNAAERFVAYSDTKMALLFIWGHSWELDANQPGNSWQYMKDLCQLLGGLDKIWYATAIEVADYLNAIRMLEHSPNGAAVTNRASLSVWVRNKKNGTAVEVPPGATLQF